MDEGNALVIEIGRRAKAKERAASGEPMDEDEEDEAPGDVDAIKESAAEDVAKALGIDPEKVDLPALAEALCQLYEAESLKSSAPKKKKAAEY